MKSHQITLLLLVLFTAFNTIICVATRLEQIYRTKKVYREPVNQKELVDFENKVLMIEKFLEKQGYNQEEENEKRHIES